MFTYTNGKNTITTACEITGGGWELVNKASAPVQNTRSEGEKGAENTKPAKRKKNE